MIEEFNIRENIEEREESLSPYAVRSKNSLGRKKNEDPDPIRTAFQRDRDRIIHSKAFRRLKHKTQVFIAPRGDHYVTRLTHTLEVSQVARTLARSLNLNEDLSEAIAMGHDLGHTPFGHIGEEVLNDLFNKGFRHNEQSLRVVDSLENEGEGLNLSEEVRNGIVNHSKSTEKILESWAKMGTFEGEICRIADSIAYINHDIDDALRAGIIKGEELPESASVILGNSRRKRINTMVLDIIEQSWTVSGKTKGEPAISMSEPVRQATNTLRDFLFSKVYIPNDDCEESQTARQTVKFLYDYFRDNGDKLPHEYLVYSDEPEQRVVDYISGMTDQYATNLAEKLRN
ncbi:MAG: deoxyguanosinetriphosphate triphosphohydrolase [Dehalococcoidales bacterium]|nr:MAG: deoxyguanosinetriphosphate triphosphohydrolase [Dehalococcoidales bacterium]